VLLEFRGDGHGLAGEQRRDPFGGPGALAGIVDAGKRLQGNGLGDIVGERAAVWRMFVQEDLKAWKVNLREVCSAGEPLNPRSSSRCALRGG
jgi:hypothetical protein